MDREIEKLVSLALAFRKKGLTNDERYLKVLKKLKEHHVTSPEAVRAIMHRIHAKPTPPLPTVPLANNSFFSPPSSFTSAQKAHLKRQIEMYKSLVHSLQQIQPPGHGQVKSNPMQILGDKGASEGTGPSWKRVDKNLVYFGPPQLDGNRIPFPKSGFGAYQCGTWGLALDVQAVYDERMMVQANRKQKRMVELQNSKSSGSLEHLLLQVDPLQSDLRRQVLASYASVMASKGMPVSVDRMQYRRSRVHAKDSSREVERAARKKLIEAENARRQKHQVYLRAILGHARDFFAYHKMMQTNATKMAKAVKSVVDQRLQRAEREEDRQEKLRLKALKANDMEAYSKLVAEAKNERLTYLLNQTDHYLEDIREMVREHRESHNLPPPNKEGADLDYLGIIQRGELPRQPLMLIGGDLKEYQLRGLQWMASLYENKLNGILADEMGLGKTIQSIALLTFVMEVKRNNGPFLVVVPLSTLSNWVNEFRKWAPDIYLVVYKGAPTIRKDIFRDEMASGQFNVLLTTYEYIMKDKHVLRKYHWQYIIVDEGHRMKNAQSKFAQTLGSVYTSRNRLLLTGTPLQNSLPELWALLNFLLPTIFKSVDTFEQWFSKPFAQFSGTGETNELSDEERMLIINRLHQVLRPFLLRRVKSSVMDQLPDKVEKVLKCDLSGWQKILYRQIQEGNALLLDPTSAAKAKGNVLARGLSNIIMQLRKVCNHPYLFQLDEGYPIDFTIVRSAGKFELLDRMLPKLKAGGHRVLMFSQMTQLMTILEDYFNWRGYRYLRLDGSTSADEREQRMFMFNASDSPFFIFLLSTRAGGLGLNLATADTVILFDSDWNPAMDSQAQDRAHRIGQKNEVRVFRLVTNSPIEEKILSRATDKLNMNNLIVEAGKFNNKSKEEERKAMLENLIKLENEDNQDDDEGALDDDQINEMMALTDEELELYRKMDIQRQAQELQDWEEMKRINPKLVGTIPSRLMEEKDAPEWLRKADKEINQQKAAEQFSTFDNSKVTSGPRKRKDISYRQMSDTEFGQMLNEEIDPSAAAEEPEYLPPTIEKNDDNAMVTLKCKEYRKVLKSIRAVKDKTGRKRSDIFVELPSKELYPDYYEIIKQPIAIDVIRKRIDAKGYPNHEDFVQDLNLMFENAKLYNGPESWVYQDAIALNVVVEKEMNRIASIDFEALLANGGSQKKKRKR